MAAIWGMEKFHYFLYGEKFVLLTDHRPLVSIFRKHLVNVSTLIQRIAIRSWSYDFETQWIPGKLNVTLTQVQDSDIQNPVRAVNILSISNIQQGDKVELQKATKQDGELQALSRLIPNGWPEKRSNLLRSLQPYWNFRDEMTAEDSILFKNRKIIIPRSLQDKYLERIHSVHQGIEKYLEKAREFIYWNGYVNDIKKTVEKCSLCQETRKIRNSDKFKYVSSVPPHPWHTLGSDIFYWKRRDFLVIVDYFSKFLIIGRIPNSTTEAVIRELGMLCSEYGRPYLF